MFDKMKQLMEMKKQAEEMKRQLDAEEIGVEKINGIKMVINGSQKFRSITVDEKQLSPDNKEQFEKDLLTSVNAALEESQAVAAQKMKNLMPGFPG